MGYYAYGYGHHVPEAAKIVAAAFKEGRPRKRNNCESWDGSYYLVNSVIAEGYYPGHEHINTMRVLEGLKPLNPVRFSFAGWPTKMTARHLSALGIKAECWGIKNPKCYMNGKPVNPSRWYTLEDIEALPPEPPKPVKPPPPPGEPDPQLPLFPEEELCAA